MRKIEKIQLKKSISSELSAKQRNINKRISPPDWHLDREQRSEIKSKLMKSQKGLCCYCECAIDYGNIHIEHFFERHDFPNLIYDYTKNLLLSCEGDRQPKVYPESPEEKEERVENISCGHKKSQGYNSGVEINYKKLINPLQVEKELLSYINGFISPSRQCNEKEEDMAIYTIKRLDLDCMRLNNLRTSVILQVNKQLLGMNMKQQKLFISDLLDENQEFLPSFYSTIKSNFGFILEE